MELTLPPFEYKVKRSQDVVYIYDIIRKKYVVLTPEEWVRQHFLHYLINHKKYPAALLSIEKEVVVNELKRRFDLVCFDRKGKPFLVVECKAPEVNLTQAVFDQVFEYNTILKAPYIAVTNGIKHFCGYRKADGQMVVESDILEFEHKEKP